MRASLILFLGAPVVRAVQIGADGKAVLVKQTSQECDACSFAVLAARKALSTLTQSELEDLGVKGWLSKLEMGCEGDDGCDALLSSSKGKTLAGSLVDIVEEGADATERQLEVSAFQAELCSTVAEVCPERHSFPSVRSVSFTADDGDGTNGAGRFEEDVAFYRRGSHQAGMLPLEPALVLPPGHSQTVHEEAGTVLKLGFAFRLLPLEDFECSHGGGAGVCEVSCSLETAREAIAAMEQMEAEEETAAAAAATNGQDEEEGTKATTKSKNKKNSGNKKRRGAKASDAVAVKESAVKRQELKREVAARAARGGGTEGEGQGGSSGGGGGGKCLAAEWACRATKDCTTVSLSPDGSHARLKTLGGGGWDSPMATDVFLDEDVRQGYIVRRNPNFDPRMPDTIPDPTALVPDGWNEDEDGVWEAPDVPNTAALRGNPRFLVYKKGGGENGSTTPGPPPAPPQHVTDAAGWSWHPGAAPPSRADAPTAAPVKKKRKKKGAKAKKTEL